MIQNMLSIFAAILALLLCLYLLIRNGGAGRSNILLTLFLGLAAALEILDLMALNQPQDLVMWRTPAMYLESLLPISWMLFSLFYVRENPWPSISWLHRFLLAASLGFMALILFHPPSTLIYSPDFPLEKIIFLSTPGFYFYIGLLIYAVISLTNLEVTLAGATHARRWKIKFDLLGAGGIFAVFIIYYSQGLLYRTLNMQLLPLRSVGLLLGVLLIAYSRILRKGGGVRISLSRNMALKSVVLLAVGLYLLGLGLIGEGMRHFGESFQQVTLIALAFLAGTGLVVLILSETVKRKTKVLLHKHFYASKHDYRIQWQQFTHRLASARDRESLQQAILISFSETFGMGRASLFLRGRDGKTFYHAAYLEMNAMVDHLPVDDPLLAFSSQRGWVVNLSQDRPKSSPKMEQALKANDAVFLVPLLHGREPEGFLILARPFHSGEVYSYEDYDLMKALALQTVSAILNLRLADQLSQAREMEAVGKVSAFVAHDLKNLVYTLSLMVENARNYMADPEFQADMVESLGNTVTRMNILISQLKALPAKITLRKDRFDLKNFTRETAAQITTLQIPVTGTEAFVEADPEELFKVVLNLLLNAVEATSGKGPVSVAVSENGVHAVLQVRDQGCGISPEFIRDDLFTPFRTTKPKGLGIGLYQSKQIVEAHGGRIEVASDPGRQTDFTVFLPKAEG